MAIGTYSELQTAIHNWLNRSDLTSRLPEFVTLAESRINRIARLLQQETTASVSITSGNSDASHPTGFLEPIDFYYASDNARLQQIPLTSLQSNKSTASGRPLLFAVSDKLYFERAAAANYTATMRYWKAWNIASDSTNWLLTNHPGVYLFNALVEAEAFLPLDSRLPVWKARADEALDEVRNLSARTRGAAPMTVDLGLRNSGAYDINSGE